ncbi:cytochrome P450 [Nodularia harveyana UHCC-0300]|uniref:Cytochrome P450 n=1 Tax=Nodularia harveyana UHCC-0300 TaxID=2974287 RepID=A0ABU5UCJ1_9CYAN|nr:cytochrome P450 [Nodularia harveyana]MEA5581043.1 cytochrome P450 [Nodularia harveyana UHCC-0300]
MPKEVPIVKAPQWLQFIQWIIDPVSYLQNCQKYSPDIFEADINGIGANQRLIFVNNPKLIQYILTHDGDTPTLGDRKELISPGDGIGVLQPLIGDRAVVMLEGEKHKLRRRLLMPPFHGERLQVYGELVTKLTTEAIAKNPFHISFKAVELTQDISLQVIMQAVFGLYQGDRYDKIRQLLIYIFDTFNSPFTSGFLFLKFLQKDWGLWGKFLRHREELDDLIYREISERSSDSTQSNRTDILSLLMTAKDETGQGMTPQELRDELITLLLAGLETTSTTMAWALYWIHRQPEVKKRVLQEIDSLGEEYTANDVVALPYLTAVCNETLRIHAPVVFTFSRVAQQDLDILDYKLPKYSRIMCCIYLLHQREDIYPEPDKFKPERFLERKYSPYEFMPFGGGARRCIGEALAMFEIKVALVTLLSRYEFALTDSRREIPKRRGVILTPNRGVPIKVIGYRK